jgi:hypothetical protein
MVAAAGLRRAFRRPGQAAARAGPRHLGGQRPIHGRWPKLEGLVDGSAAEAAPAHPPFPARHRARPHPTDPRGRRDKELERRAGVAGIFPGGEGIARPTGAAPPPGARDGRRLQQRRCRQAEGTAEPVAPTAEDQTPASAPQAARPTATARHTRNPTVSTEVTTAQADQVNQPGHVHGPADRFALCDDALGDPGNLCIPKQERPVSGVVDDVQPGPQERGGAMAR